MITKIIVSFALLLPIFSAHSEPFTAGLTALSREHATTAYRAWLKLAQDGAAEAQNNVGYLYENGLGVTQDYEQAEDWYMRASGQGLSAAKHNLAMLTYKGHINNKDTRKSVAWFREADEQDYTPSTYMLAVLYLRGEGVFKDQEAAHRLFLKAAKKGDPKAQYMVGYLHQYILLDAEDNPDVKRSYGWSAVALLNGFTKARSVMIKAAVKMKSEQEASLIKSAESCISSAYRTCDFT